MDNKRLLNIIGELDDEIIGEALDDRKISKRKALFIKIGALAACICLLATTVFPSLVIGIINAPPKASFVDFEKGITGVGEKSIDSGITVSGSYNDLTIAPGFYLLNTLALVAEVQVTEILPDKYSDRYYEYMIAKLKVLDQILGNGLPSEIYFAFDASYGEDIFDGIDSFIMSLNQIGINNFMLLNSSNEPKYFANMFTSSRKIFAYGNELAFIDGQHTLSYIKKINNRCKTPIDIDSLYEKYYPVTEGSTLQEAKDNIRTDFEEMYNIPSSNYSYINESFFNTTEESRTLLEYVSTGKSNCFFQSLSYSDTRSSISFSRNINGVSTDEIRWITNQDGKIEVTNSNSIYTQEDLASCPNIGTIVLNLDLSNLIPPHIPIWDRMKYKFSSCTADAWYKKVDGEVYGIIRITWRYYFDKYYKNSKYSDRMQVFDGCYYLYDSKGNSRIVSPDYLIELLGNDSVILALEYNRPYNISYD